MKADDLIKDLGLEAGRHYDLEGIEAPIVKADLYTTLGRRLFDLYQKYKIEKADQREIEGIIFALQNFIVAREKRPSFWKRFLRKYS